MAADKGRVGAMDYEMPSGRELHVTRRVNADRRLVWDAHTVPEHVKQWLLGPEGSSMPICEIDLRVGGGYHYVWRSPDGTSFGMHGDFREVIPPEQIVNTESLDDQPGETLNTTIFKDQDGATLIECTVVYPSEEVRAAVLATGMLNGWSASYDRLDRYLENLVAPVPEREAIIEASPQHM